MNIFERDLLISSILRDEETAPAEVLAATPSGDPDLFAVQLIANLHDGEDAATVLLHAMAAHAIHPDHMLTNLLAQVAAVATDIPDLLPVWLANLASDDMREEILAKRPVAA